MRSHQFELQGFNEMYRCALLCPPAGRMFHLWWALTPVLSERGVGLRCLLPQLALGREQLAAPALHVPETEPGSFWRSFKMKLLRIFAWSKGCFPCLRQAATCSQKEEGTEFTPEVFILQKYFRSFFQGKTAVVGGRWGNRVQHSEHCNWEDF